MEKIKKIIREYNNILIYITIALFFIMFIFIVQGNSFNLDNDQELQYHIFYREWINLVKDFLNGEGLPMYSWNSFLGEDFFSAQAYYVVGDIFLPFLMLFDDVKQGLFFETIICVYIAGISFKRFLSIFRINDNNVIDFVSLVYAINGCIVLLFGNYMWVRFYAFLPLLFIGTEKYLQYNKKNTFIISVALLFLSNFYFMFPTSIFLMFYVTLRCYIKNIGIKSYFYKSFTLILLYFLGLSLVAFIMFPAFNMILSSPRIGDGSINSIFWEFQTYLGLFFNWLHYYPLVDNIFWAGTNGHEIMYSLMIGMLPLTLSISFLFNKKNRAYLIMFIILLGLLFFRPGSSFMHGFSQPSLRWSFIIVFYMLLLCASSLDNFDQKNFNKSLILVLILIFLSLLGSGYLVFYDNRLLVHYISLFISVTFSFFICLLFNKNKKYALILSIVYLVIVNTNNIAVRNFGNSDYQDTIDRKLMTEFINSDSDLLFRYYIDNKHLAPGGTLNLNKNIDSGFMGTSYYNSVYDYNLNEFLNQNDISWHIIKLDDPNIMNMLGVKYYIVYEEEELPKEHSFEYCYNIEHLKVFKNLDFIGFGYATDIVKYSHEINSLKEFNNTIFVDDNFDLSNYLGEGELLPFNIFEKGNNFLKGEIQLNNASILQIPIPNNMGWKIIVNGEEKKSIPVNGGFVGIELTEGKSSIEMYFMSPYFKIGLVISMISVVMLFVLNIFDKLKSNK